MTKLNRRLRSPKYPSIGLERALELASAIELKVGYESAKREALAKAMGFSGLTGSSTSMISSLFQFGLLENTRKGEAAISTLAIGILWFESEDDREVSLFEAALKPDVFELVFMQDAYTDGSMNSIQIASFLRSQGFSPKAAEVATNSYEETIQFIESTIGIPIDQHSTARAPLRLGTSMMKPQQITRFQDLMKFPVGNDDRIVRIMTNNGDDLNSVELEDLIVILQARLNRLNTKDPEKESTTDSKRDAALLENEHSELDDDLPF